MADGWDGKSRGGRTGHRIFIFLIRHFGVKTAYVLLFFVVLYFIPAAPKSTGDIWRYARKILNYDMLRSAVFIFRNYWSFGQSIIDRFAITSGLDGKYSFEFENVEPIVGNISAGRGAVVICAHFGNWAAGEPFFRKYKAAMNLVMFDNEAAEIKKVISENGNPERGFKIIPVNRDNLMHVFMITEALDRGELVCLMGDRYLNEDKLLASGLLGHPAKFPYGPFLLASKLKIPVFFYNAVRRQGMTYRFSFRQAEIPKQEKGAEMAVLKQFTETLGNFLRQYPEQWYNYYDFWGLRAG